jgi:hypothetical protein
VHPTTRLAALAVLSAALFSAPRPAQAETYQTCAGFIDSLPATISTQGTWCLRGDLGTAMASGAAITIAANNVTIDCNDFKLGGLAAGDATRATGIQAVDRLNATVRSCHVRGFLHGTHLTGSGHAVLDSHFDNNTHVGLYVQGDGAVVRGNRVSDTGGSTSPTFFHAYGIYLGDSAAGVVHDNFVQGVYAAPGSNGSAFGLMVALLRGDVTGNTVAGLQAAGSGHVRGINNVMSDTHAVIQDNTVGVGIFEAVTGIGVGCLGAIARNNAVSGTTTGYSGCEDAGGNYAN